MTTRAIAPLPGNTHVQPPLGLRVLMLNYEYPPLGGGAGFATAALAERLASRGARVDVVTAAADPDRAAGSAHLEVVEPTAEGERLTLYRVRARRRSVHQAGFGAAGGYLLRALPVVRGLLRRRRYEIVHFFFSLPTGALLPFLDLRDSATVVSLRGSDVPGYDRSNAKLEVAHQFLRPLTRRIWRGADRVVPVCQHLGELARLTDPTVRYTVIGNGVDLDVFRPAEQTMRSAAGPLRCVAVTRLVERKGLGDLLRAWTMLERGRYTLELVGTGPGESELRSMVVQLGLQDDVTFAGALHRDEVAERYRHADLFTLAPHHEAFGNVFAEALAAGLPIVASNVGGIPELVDDGVNGLLVSPGEPADLARAIRTLGENGLLRAEMSQRNRARAEETLSWDTITDRYLETYAELMATAPRVSSHKPAAIP